MNKIYFVSLFLFASGCSVFQPEESTLIQPKLLKQSDLPPIKESLSTDYFEFYCEMQINVNGDVERAKLLIGTGDVVWDSLAALSLLEWKYTPAIFDGHPIKLVVRRKVKVVFVEPKIILLSEIELSDSIKADSVFTALKGGADFISLVQKYSISPTREKNGMLGQINLKHFSNEISTALNELEEGEFTKPLHYGDHFIIYKKLKLNN